MTAERTRPIDAIRAILLRGLALARDEKPAPAWREVACVPLLSGS